MSDEHQQGSGHSHRPVACALRRVAHTSVLALGVFAGLLMWSRLKIVTATPRSAFAVPRGVEADSPSQHESRDIETLETTEHETSASKKSENPTTP